MKGRKPVTIPTTPVKYHRLFSFFLCVLCALCGEISSQDFKTVHPGVEHAQVTHMIGSDPVKINLLRVDLTKVRLDVHHALDKAIGRETTSSIAKRKGAIAAINAGFFRLDKSVFAGEAADYLLIDGELLSEGDTGRTGLHIINEKKKTEVHIDRFRLNAWLGSFDSRFMSRLSGVNRVRKDNEILLFDSSFGDSTPADQYVTHIVLRNCRPSPGKWQNVISCAEYEIVMDSSNTPIPDGGYVISIAPGNFKEKQLLMNELKVLNLAETKRKSLFIKFEDSITKSSYSQKHDIVAGVPQLVRNGTIDITWEQEKSSKVFVETRRPRTAVAKLRDGKFLMVTVDGRQPAVSVGMNLRELAEYLLSLGAIDAMNLDGGGSTTMFLDGKVINTPSDKEGERKIGDAIIVTLRKRR